jgi:hypothetical protein
MKATGVKNLVAFLFVEIICAKTKIEYIYSILKIERRNKN